MSNYVNNKGFVSIFTLITCILVCTVLAVILNNKVIFYNTLLIYKENNDILTNIKKDMSVTNLECNYYISKEKYNKITYYEYLTTEQYNELNSSVSEKEDEICLTVIKKDSYTIFLFENDDYIYLKNE